MYSLVFLLTMLISLILIVLHQDSHTVISVVGLCILIILAIFVAGLADYTQNKLDDKQKSN